MQALCELLGVDATPRILDVGGTALNWTLLDVRPRVTLLNIGPEEQRDSAGFTCISADARHLPFGDGAFDVVFSNSVLEHVGNREQQRRFAEEVRRVGRCYWVQTPNRWYPIETHLLTPLLHFLPMRIQRLLARRWTVWDLIERPSPDRRAFYIEHYLNTIRLLTASELRALFPGSRLLRERHLGFTKSLIVVKTLWILHSGARRCQNRAEMIFQNRTALVTGASRGIGKAIALRLASEGVAVGVNYRERADEAERVAAEIVARGGRAVTAGADVSDESAVAAMVAKVEAELGPIDILINNAGIFRRMELGEVDWDVMEQMQRTNVRGVVVPIRAVVEGMRKRGHGRIINLSSLAAHGTSMAGTTFYAATKAEVVILTRRFALELGPCGITVNAIAPGFIATDLVWVDRTKQEVEHLFATLAGKAMMRRVGQPEDIAAAAVYLASDEAGFITAQVITVDGGRTDYINHG